MNSPPPKQAEPPGLRRGSWPLIIAIGVAFVLGTVLLLGWTLFVSFREPWNDMERAFDAITIPDGFGFESEERRGSGFPLGDPPSISRTYVALDDAEAIDAGLCAPAVINDATVTSSNEMSCRATTSVNPSLIERIVFWNGGYNVSIITSDDQREEHPVMLRVIVAK